MILGAAKFVITGATALWYFTRNAKNAETPNFPF